MIGEKVPNVTLYTRIRDESIEGPNPFRWELVQTGELFAGKTVVVFSLPGAFTPTCSTYQLPNFEKLYNKFKLQGVDEVYVCSVNDAFVMNKWLEHQDVKNVKALPDGNGDFTRAMGMLVDKENLGFGKRSWRYAFIARDGNISHWFVEPGFRNNADDDPYGETDPEHILKIFLDSLD